MSARPLEPDTVAAFAPLPRRLGKYEIQRVLGEGAMGVVYQAFDPVIHRPVALKTIRRPLLQTAAPDMSAALRFRHEAQAAGRLSHPNIVSVYEYGEDGDDTFIAMEYVEGHPLARGTTRGIRLPVADVLSVMAQLLDALHAAHEQGVWHRDVKPANLIVTPDGRLKVTDFGIARIDTADMTQTTSTMGSPGYMAPERYTGEAPDRRVDIFAAGVLLYELLSGAPPFMGPSNTVMYQVLHTDPPPPSAAPLRDPPPACFDAVVARAIAKRPDARFESAHEFRDALAEAAASAGIAAIAPRLSREAVARLAPLPPDLPPTPEAPGTDSGRASSRAPTTAPPPAWDPATLDRLEGLLRPHLGPLARVVVKRHAAECTGLAALVARLAREALTADDRRSFLADAATAFGSRCRPTAPASASSAPGAAPAAPLFPVLGATPMRPETVEAARQVLASHIGPIARLMVRNAASVASTREHFFALLADLSGDSVERDVLLRDLARLR